MTKLEIPGSARIESLDVMRGFVLLGIFLINLNYFSIPSVERYHPTVDPNFGGLNLGIWIAEYVLVKQRFMSIFALLFGAGMWLMAEKVKARGENSGIIHLRRMGGLLLIGCMHAYLIWDGDILVSYALCGLLVFWLRNLKTSWLLLIGAVMVLGSFWETALGFLQPVEIGEGYLAWWNPGPADLEAARQAMQGTWWEMMPQRAAVAWERQTIDWLYFTIWRVGGLMLVGMALMKNGFLVGKMDKKIYRRWGLMTGLPGLTLSLWGALTFIAKDYDLRFFMEELSLSFWLGSLLMSFSYVCWILLWVKSGGGQKIRKRLAEVGKLSLSNYIFQSVVGTLVFFGYGLGYFGEMSRTELLGVAILTWALQIGFSWLWLRRFNYGPLEVLWRALTYGKWPNWKKNP